LNGSRHAAQQQNQMAKFEPRPPRMSVPSAQRPARTYVVQAAVVDRDAWRDMPNLPDRPPLAEDEALPLPSDEYDPTETGTHRVAMAPPVPRGRAVPASTAVIEKQPEMREPEPDARPTPVAEHIARAPLASDKLTQARTLLGAGRLQEALALLRRAATEQPEDLACRAMLLVTCIGLRQAALVKPHADWLIARFAHADQDPSVCDVYARILAAGLDVSLEEASLLAVVAAAGRAQQGALVIAATNQLLRLYPGSFGLPTALLAAAQHQVAVGRLDLARRTLEHVRDQYPMSLSAFQAEERLRKLSR
jgi:hypothetical protein